MKPSFRRYACVTFALIGAVVVLGCGGADRQGTDVRRSSSDGSVAASIDGTTGEVEIALKGGTADDAGAVRTILRNMGTVQGISAITIGTPQTVPNDEGFTNGATSAPTDVWLTFYGEPATTLDGLIADWKAQLIAGAAQEALPVADGHTLVGRTIMLGTTRYSIVTRGWAKEQTEAVSSDDGAVVADATAAVRASGVTNIAVDVIHPFGPALIITGTTDRDGALDRARSCSVVTGVDGCLVILYDKDGALAAVSGFASRQHTGVGWTVAPIPGDPAPRSDFSPEERAALEAAIASHRTPP